MTLKEAYDFFTDKAGALFGIIITGGAIMFIKLVFIGQEGSVIMKITKSLASAGTGIFVGYLITKAGGSSFLSCLSTALVTLMAEKLIRLIYEEGPTIVFNGLKTLFEGFINKFKPTSKNEPNDRNP